MFIQRYTNIITIKKNILSSAYSVVNHYYSSQAGAQSLVWRVEVSSLSETASVLVVTGFNSESVALKNYSAIVTKVEFNEFAHEVKIIGVDLNFVALSLKSSAENSQTTLVLNNETILT